MPYAINATASAQHCHSQCLSVRSVQSGAKQSFSQVMPPQMTALLLLCTTTAYQPPHHSHARTVQRDAQRTYTLTDAEGATDLLEITTKAEGRTFVLDGSKMLTLYECSFYEGKLGYQVWPAALAGAAWACKNKALFEGKRVLELGSGVGLLVVPLPL